jgi:hypothetical protein
VLSPLQNITDSISASQVRTRIFLTKPVSGQISKSVHYCILNRLFGSGLYQNILLQTGTGIIKLVGILKTSIKPPHILLVSKEVKSKVISQLAQVMLSMN